MLRVVYCASCGEPIAGYNKETEGPGKAGWDKPNPCPKCGKEIDYRRKVIVHNKGTDRITLVREPDDKKLKK